MRTRTLLLLTILVVLCTSGGAVAGGLAANVVGSKQIKNGSIKAVDVKKDALTGATIKESTLSLPAGPAGAPGAPGAPAATAFMANVKGSCNDDAFAPLTGFVTCSTTEAPTQVAMSVAGTFNGIYATQVSPSNTAKVILRVNGVSTALSCTTGGQPCTNLATSVHVNFGDLVSILFDCTTTDLCGNALTAERAIVSLRFRPD